MKILWIVNVKLPIIYKRQGAFNEINVGGWLDRISQGILEKQNVELFVCYPYSIKEEGQFENLHYQSLTFNPKDLRLGKLKIDVGIEETEKILKSINPDIIHIHGTEFQYSYFFAEAAKRNGMDNKLIVSIQGMVGIYARHVSIGLPEEVRKGSTLREILLNNNVQSVINSFIRRGIYEEKTIKITKHIIGRTSWDRACTYRINPDAKYHHGDETLREIFYTGEWSFKNCVKHRIFISQATYPVKGFHIFLDALSDIKKFFPDVSVHVAGGNPIQGDWLRGSTYGRYLKQKIKSSGFEDCVKFCGNLNAEQMKHEMLEANVFVSPSTIENSPNSVGEAMLLGVPIVSSNVGGVSDLLKDKIEGYLYQSDAPYMLAYYVILIFRDSERATQMGIAAKARALHIHDYMKNLRDLFFVYKEIKKGK